ncbi:MAG: N-6 DNA methylase [Peptoclostridium sp.]|uniref:class I SAM-dependent DNA methyltransferase n=1 Tax=Peptoclostridium sp. TaxID=1904860 RepID=UPI00139D15FD|nr:DNA methyltransferase [Peptoclostridium sp.]MZQ75190.1 N-6 DNA methylase [Peptoclostridium sp.]
MALGWDEITGRAMAFSKKWKNTIDESAEAQSFLNDFFNVFGVDRKRVATFETKVPIGKTRNGYIDLLWKGVILVEMKSMGKSLDKAYDQARDYAFNLHDEDLPEYIMVCDFQNIRLYRNTTGQVWNFKTSELHKKVKLFSSLAGYKTSTDMPKDQEVDIKAAEKMAKLHDILKSHGYEGHPLEVYLVRLLFCLFADDTGIFEKNIFFDYIENSKEDGSDLAFRIARLFEVLDMPDEQRTKHTMLSDELKRFRYINGKLFEEPLPFADFDHKMRKMLLECCALDWGYISPAIFGAMFQGVMNPKERRELGAHYTSEENILKVIRPLFLDELWKEFEHIKGDSKQLQLFHDKLGKLRFLDPACGCGNFLIITYRELRRLELEVIKMLTDNQAQLMLIHGITSSIKVNVEQFYGIEYEEFPAQIAQVGMWLMDHQMNTLVAEHFGLYYARLPLKQSATIVHSNALKVDWEDIVPKYELSYIIGNPPFVGARWMTKEQKSDLLDVFENHNCAGNLDYVSAWYVKAAQMMDSTTVETGFVSTNSITQGEQVFILWKYLIEKYNVVINYAYRTFFWNNDAKGKAKVHCVIIGFSNRSRTNKLLFDSDGIPIRAERINGYLIDAPDIFIQSRSKPLCNVPEMRSGNKPVDGGNYLFTEDEKNEFVKLEPLSECYFMKFLGSDEFINGYNRWCLYLENITPSELRKMPLVMQRVEAVRKFRESSSSKPTQKLAETPLQFHVKTIMESSYIVIPQVSSFRRKYIPIGFLSPDVICSDKLRLIPNATLYHFGVLTSKIHMIWTKVTCGRLKSDYQYSKDIVYNNFPWPDPTETQKKAIEDAAQTVLDVRTLYPNDSLADLYDPLAMPLELVKAHNNLDRAVVVAYGGGGFKIEAERVADLMQRYSELVNAEQKNK